jgi:hypothetical protein
LSGRLLAVAGLAVAGLAVAGLTVAGLTGLPAGLTGLTGARLSRVLAGRVTGPARPA